MDDFISPQDLWYQIALKLKQALSGPITPESCEAIRTLSEAYLNIARAMHL